MTYDAPEAPAYIYRAVVRSIYDGDTLRLDIDLGFSIWMRNETIRLLDIDTPEIRGDERADGLTAKAFVEAFCPPGSQVLIRTHKDRTGKYGRYLAEIWLDGLSLGDALLEADLAVPYGGVWR